MVGSVMAGADPDLRGTRVLVVDDDADNCTMLATVLTQSGALVETALSAAEAVRAFERHEPHVVLTDIGLGEEDGFTLLRKLRQLPHAAGHDVAAIALTGRDGPEDRARIEREGFHARLTKPVEFPVMLATIARAVRSR
jgi:CheY-like chemotaxis protein